jgi:hypothetical protein
MRREHLLQFMIDRGEVMWYQVGMVAGDRWAIAKGVLQDLVNRLEPALCTCPVFRKDTILATIDFLPDSIPLDDPLYEFIPVKYKRDRTMLMVLGELGIMPEYLVEQRKRTRRGD